jgi:DNA-binding MarR family transcriptional regulator
MGRDALMRQFFDQQRELTRLQAQWDVPVIMELDLTMQQLRALTFIAHAEGLTAQGLAAHLKVSAATVSGLLGRLERRGLVRRQPSATDHRAKQILLTDEGAELLQRLDTVGTELWARVAGELTEAEVSQLVALTSRIVEIVRLQAGRHAGTEGDRRP